MSNFYDIINLGSEGSKILSEKYKTFELKSMLSEVEKLQDTNKKTIDQLLKNGKRKKLFPVWKNQKTLNKISNMINDAIAIQEYSENRFLPTVQKARSLSIDKHIILNKENLIPLRKKVEDLGTNINNDKQFFYNFKQENMEVTHELSFEVDMFFEPLAPIPLRLQHNFKVLNQGLSFEIGFS